MRHRHLPLAVRSAAIALIPACGFVGFERGEDFDTHAPPSQYDAGMDASVRTPPDAGPQSNLDANVVADTGLGEDGSPDAFVDPDPPATNVNDYCLSLPRLRRNPVIDGVVDSMLDLKPLEPVGWTASGSTPLPAHTTTTFAAAWRPNGLYVFVHVVDPNRLPPKDGRDIWEGDGVELYFDNDGLFAGAPTYDNPGMIQIIVAAPEDDTTPSTRSQRFRNAASQGAWMSSMFAAFPTADGYILEGMLQADSVDVLSLGLHIGESVGIDLGVNVSVLDDRTDAGTLENRRLGQYFLQVTSPISGCGGQPYCTPAALCTPTLVD